MRKLLILACLLCLTSCNESRLVVSAEITTKYDYTYTQIINTGKSTINILHHKYIFIFNEVEPYRKTVNGQTYVEYEEGDIYSFIIDPKETKYFFEDSVVNTSENGD